MEGAFPTQGMPDLGMDLGSIAMTWADAGDGELNTALLSQEWEALFGGEKAHFGAPPALEKENPGRGVRAGSGHGAMGSPGWEPRQALATPCASSSSVHAPSFPRAKGCGCVYWVPPAFGRAGWTRGALGSCDGAGAGLSITR